MFKDVLRDSNLTIFATLGLVVFFVVFTAIVVWVLTRPKNKVEKWASLPLKDGTEPVESRDDELQTSRTAKQKDSDRA